MALLKLMAPLLLGAVIVLAYGLAEWDGVVLIVAAAVGAAASAVGALLGFLFGIPRSYTAETAPMGPPGGTTVDPAAPQYRPNTNLEQVSDWLTKILVGVGLAQAGEVADAFEDLTDGVKPALGGDDVAHAFGGAELVYFVIAGFLCSYLYTRLRLQRELEDATEHFQARIAAETAGRSAPDVH